MLSRMRTLVLSVMTRSCYACIAIRSILSSVVNVPILVSHCLRDLYQSSNILRFAHVQHPNFLRNLPESNRARRAGGIARHGQEHPRSWASTRRSSSGQAARVADQQLRLLPADPSQRVAAGSWSLQEKLDLAATRHEAGIFSDKGMRRAGLGGVRTRLADRSVPDEAYEAVCQHFSSGRGHRPLSVAIANINAWNRLGAAFRFAPPIQKKVVTAA